MTISELATVIFMLCGDKANDATYKCYDYMVNCAVNKNGKIVKKTVDSCIIAYIKDQK